MKKVILFIGFLSFILCLRLLLFYSNLKTYQNGEYVSFETQVSSIVKEYSSYKTIYINLDPVTKALVKTSLDKDLSYGNMLKISGNLETRLLDSNATIFTLNYPKIEASFRENYLKSAKIYYIRQRIIEVFNANLDKNSADLMLGIVFGIKQNLNKEFSNQIQVVGLTHVIAASGMNVTLVSGFLFYLLSYFFKRQWAISLSVLGILFYVCLTGFEPSIVRAAIMGILVFSSQILGRQQLSLLTLFFTGFVMLFIWPQFLVNIGFQLSFLSTLGIIYLPDLFKRIKNGVTEDLIITLSAQITTLPIILYNFGNYSFFSLASNVLVLWVVPILMILGFIASVFSFIYAPVSSLILYLCLPLLLYFQKIVNIFSSLGSINGLNTFPWQLVVAYYLFLASFLVYKYSK